MEREVKDISNKIKVVSFISVVSFIMIKFTMTIFIFITVNKMKKERKREEFYLLLRERGDRRWRAAAG